MSVEVTLGEEDVELVMIDFRISALKNAIVSFKLLLGSELLSVSLGLYVGGNKRLIHFRAPTSRRAQNQCCH